MASDIEKKLDAIFDSLMSDLTGSAAIDKEYKIVKPQVFLDIITKKESEINKLFELVEENGSITDREGSDLIYARLQILSDMKERMSATPYKINFDDEHDEKPKKAFKLGLFRLFKRTKTGQKMPEQNSR